MRMGTAAGVAAGVLAACSFSAMAGKAPKVDICHFDQDTASYAVISVSGNAVDKHFANHGDSYPGNYFFDADGDGLGDSFGAADDCPNEGFVDNGLDLCPDEAADTEDGCPAPVLTLGKDLVTGKAGEFGHKGNVAILFSDGTRLDSPQNVWDTNHAVAVGDFNEDGQDDVFLLNSRGPVFVALGDFSAGMSFSQVGTVTDNNNRARALTVGDFNNDGHQDVVVIGWSIVSAFLGNGDGTFGAEITSPALYVDNRSIASGDFDGDGFLDIAVSNQPGNTFIQVSYGNGDGTFAGSVVVGGGELVRDNIHVADTDGDGDLDIITAGWGSQFRIYENNGSGDFATGLVVGEGTGAHNLLVVGDVDGDGDADVVTGRGYDISVHLNDGAGNFAAPQVHAGGFHPRHGVIADVNEDGIPDIATVNAEVFQNVGDSNNVTVYPGLGGGSFGPSYNLPNYRNNWTIGAGNFK